MCVCGCVGGHDRGERNVCVKIRRPVGPAGFFLAALSPQRVPAPPPPPKLIETEPQMTICHSDDTRERLAVVILLTLLGSTPLHCTGRRNILCFYGH